MNLFIQKSIGVPVLGMDFTTGEMEETIFSPREAELLRRHLEEVHGEHIGWTYFTKDNGDRLLVGWDFVQRGLVPDAPGADTYTQVRVFRCKDGRTVEGGMEDFIMNRGREGEHRGFDLRAD